MYQKYIKNEIKNWSRDPLIVFLFMYPFVMGMLARYGVPWLGQRYQLDMTKYYDYILVGLAIIVPYMYGVIAAFTLLDDRDDKVILSIRVSPIKFGEYLVYKLFTVFVLSLFACVGIVSISGLGNVSAGTNIMVGLISSFSALISAMLVNVVARNKVEGFAMMKGTGFLIILPIIALSFYDMRELYFMISPSYWPAKMLSAGLGGMTLFEFNTYLVFGLIYNVTLIAVLYVKLKKKIKSA